MQPCFVVFWTQRNYFPSISLFLCLPHITLGWSYQKNVKVGVSEKSVKGGELCGIMYRRGFRPSAHYECGTDTCGEFIVFVIIGI